MKFVLKKLQTIVPFFYSKEINSDQGILEYRKHLSKDGLIHSVDNQTTINAIPILHYRNLNLASITCILVQSSRF
jgi:hypothetical protein